MNSTLVGSLPFLNLEAATQSFSKVSLPVYPNLIKLDEAETLINFWDNYLSDMSLPSNFNYFINILKTNHKRFAVHICGPTTHRKYSKLRVSDSEYLESYQHFFSRFDPKQTIIFLDEPAIGDDFDLLKLVMSSLSQFEFGVHSCAKFDWEEVTQQLVGKIRFLSYDCELYQKKMSTSLEIELIHGFDIINNPHKLSFDQNEWISPSCGLGLMSEKKANEIINKL